MSTRARMIVFGGLVAVSLVVAVTAVLAAGGNAPVPAGSVAAGPVSRTLLSDPHFVFRDTARGAGYGASGSSRSRSRARGRR